MKTVIVPAHEVGPATNGHDGCHARAGHDGLCPGVSLAEWLNGLPNDDEIYCVILGDKVSNGQVRDNWLRENTHIVAKEPELAKLRAEERRLSAELRMIKRRIQNVIGGK